MAFIGNSDALGNGTGLALFTLASDVTSMSANDIANTKVGQRALVTVTAVRYVMITNSATPPVKTWAIDS